MIYKTIGEFDGQPTFEKTVDQILADFKRQLLLCKRGDVLECKRKKYDSEKEMSLRQIRWWKGVLLPALAKDNGESVSQWETRLKLNVMPDEFDIQTVKVHGVPVSYIPSVKILSIKKSNLLVEGSVAHLRDETVYGDKYQWVTLPDPNLRK